MKLRILSVGTKPPAWVREGFAAYAKRLPPDMALDLVEIPAPKHRGNARGYVETEGARMMAQIQQSDRVIAMEDGGVTLSSAQLATKMDNWRMQGENIVFLVGGSDGLSASVRDRADECLSLSALTFPHYMVRVVLAEALYRAWSICAGHPYHRE
jgi:23S rRNA (pseudouridine1915-N3)-methyltransferase